MVLLLNTVDQTQRVWTRATAKAGQFQAARGAFESHDPADESSHPGAWRS